MSNARTKLISVSALTLALLLLAGSVEAAQTLNVVRPDRTVQIQKLLSNCSNDFYAGVSLSTYVYQYTKYSGGPYNSDIVNMNVSMAANTRRVNYQNDESKSLDDYADSWKWNWNYIYVESYTDLRNDSGFWLDLPTAQHDFSYHTDGFTFIFYGVKYRNWTAYSIASHLWVCTNGFISLDPSMLNTSSPSAFPSDASRAVIAPFWTPLDFISGTSEIDIALSAAYGLGYYFIVKWVNMHERGTSNFCTFGVALRIYDKYYHDNAENGSPDDLDGIHMTSGDIWLVYWNMSTPANNFATGLEDQTGGNCYGYLAPATQAAGLNGKSLRYRVPSNFVINRLILTFQDSNPTGSFEINQSQTFGRNVASLANAPNDSSMGFDFPDSLLVNTALDSGGVLVSIDELAWGGLGAFATPVNIVFLGYGIYSVTKDVYDWWVGGQSRANPIQTNFTYSQAQACVSAPAYDNCTGQSDTVTDASLETVSVWMVGNEPTVNHALTITATVEYKNSHDPSGNPVGNVSTAANVNLFVDNNDDVGHAQQVSYGFRGNDPMLYIGCGGNGPCYDQDDFYNITVQQNSITGVQICPEAALGVSVEVKDRGGTVVASNHTGSHGDVQHVAWVAAYTGNYTIHVIGQNGWGFYNMTIIPENLPNAPSMFSGPTSGYVYTNYTYTTCATDPDNDTIRYLFIFHTPGTDNYRWTDWNSSGVSGTSSFSWDRPGQKLNRALSQDCYGLNSSASSPILLVNITQNDDGYGLDAGNDFASATTYSPYPPTGTLYQSNPTDPEDWYKFYAKSGYSIAMNMTPPSASDFDLELYSPSNNQTAFAGSHNSTGLQEKISTTANETGWWRARIYYRNGSDGQYTFNIATAGGGSGCPFAYDWNGSSYVKDNNILPASETGNGTDTRDYYLLQQPLVPVFVTQQASSYSLQIREFESEQDYIDQVKLVAVDHSQGTRVAVTPEGEIVTYANPVSPFSCTDENGSSHVTQIDRMDGNVSCPATYFQGYSGDWLVLDFGTVTSSHASIIFRDDQKCAGDNCIDVQVPDMNGGWRTVEVLHPRDFWAMEAVNMTGYLPQTGDFIVRLLWTSTHRLDYVGLDTSLPAQVRVTAASPRLAVHSIYGNVTVKVLYDDENCVELVNGQQITLAFTLPNKALGTARDFILYTDGYYYTITP